MEKDDIGWGLRMGSRLGMGIMAVGVMTSTLCPAAAAPSATKPLDIVVASHEGFQVFFGQGNGRFQASDQGFIELEATTSVVLGDLDGDGDLDLFVTRYQQETNQVWCNDGKGRFQKSSQVFPPADQWRVTLGDLDGDGDLDAFLVGATSTSTSPDGRPNEVWLNDGKGLFTDSGQRLGKNGSADVVLTDLDGDRDLDAIVAQAGGGVIWINDGKAIFRESGQKLGQADTSSKGIALGDLDGDSDLDVFLANVGPNQVWLNQGKGQFTLSQVVDGKFDTFTAALGDLDGDGDLDAFEANRASLNRLLLNDGKGRFRDSGQDLGNWKSRKIAVGSLR